MAFSVVCITNDQNDVSILDICKNMCCFHFDQGAYSWLKKVRWKMDVCFERLETVTNLHQIMPSKGSTRHSEAPCLPRPGFPIVPFWTAFIKFVTYEIWSLEIFSPSHTDDSWKGTARTDLLERNAKKKGVTVPTAGLNDQTFIPWRENSNVTWVYSYVWSKHHSHCRIV